MGAATGRKGAIHGINITPLVDIFLVLLILVMVTSTLAPPQAIEVQVPKAASGQSAAPGSTGLVLGADGSLLLDGTVATPEMVVSGISARVRSDSTHSVLVTAAGKLPYEKVVEILDLVRKSGARKYALQVREDG